MGLVALAALDHKISVWGTGSDSGCVMALTAFKDTVFDIAWSSDGLILAACSFDGTVIFANFKTDFGEAMTKNDLVGQPVPPCKFLLPAR